MRNGSTDSESQRNQVTKSRSPKYPSTNLELAVEKVKRLYDRERKAATPRTIAAKDLGYASLNGAAAQLLSSLAQYGLIEDVGQSQVRVSGFAEALIFPTDTTERFKLLQEALRRPKVFSTLLDYYDLNGLPSNENLVARLIREHKFTQVAATECVKNLRHGVQFLQTLNDNSSVNLPKSAGHLSVEVEEEEEPDFASDEIEEQRGRVVIPSRLGEYVSGNLSETTTIEVSIDGILGKEEETRLQEWIEAILMPWLSLKAKKDQFNEAVLKKQE